MSVSNPLVLPTAQIDFAASTVERADGVISRLSTRELDLIRYLADQQAGQASRERLGVDVFGLHPHSQSRAVDTAMARLRRKLEIDAKSPRNLRTVHGVGYRLMTPGLAPSSTIRPEHTTRTLHLGDRELLLHTGELRASDGVTQLTNQQLRLLTLLADAAPCSVSTTAIARGLGLSLSSRDAVRTAISRTRAAIEPNPRKPRWLVRRPDNTYALTIDPAPRTGLAPLKQLMWRLTEHATSMLGLDDCVLYIRDGNQLVQAAAHGPKSPQPGEIVAPLVLQVGAGVVGAAAATGCAQRVRDTHSDPRYIPDVNPARSELALPILHNGHTVGVLDSESPKLDAYDRNAEAGLASIASLVAAAATDLRAALAA